MPHNFVLLVMLGGTTAHLHQGFIQALTDFCLLEVKNQS